MKGLGGWGNYVSKDSKSVKVTEVHIKAFILIYLFGSDTKFVNARTRTMMREATWIQPDGKLSPWAHEIAATECENLLRRKGLI